MPNAKQAGKKVAGSKKVGKDAESTTRLLKNQSAWAARLDKNHRSSGGVWLRLAKKNSGLQRYAILFRIQTGKKSETRARNIQKSIPMLERGEKIHPLM
jgi:Bacteriocin-protection, YdeI or OmpD-Associated